MTPATIIKETMADGVTLALSPTGNFKTAVAKNQGNKRAGVYSKV